MSSNRMQCELAAMVNAVHAESAGSDEYYKLVAEGLVRARNDDFSAAVEHFAAAILHDPMRGSAYYNMGCVLEQVQAFPQAASHYMIAADKWSLPDTLHSSWADAVASAFFILSTKNCAEASLPQWWNDKDLREVSKKAIGASPFSVRTHYMRVAVLQGIYSHRTADELMEATRICERASLLFEDETGLFDTCRRECLRRIASRSL